MNAFHFTQAGFVGVTVIFFGLFLKDFRVGLVASGFAPERQKKIFLRLVFSLVGWAIFVTLWSATGMMGNFSIFPLNMAPVLVVPLVSILAFTFSSTTREIIAHIPQQNLVRLQSFRIIVELLLWVLFVQNLLPVQMSLEGRNFDILSGLTALVVAPLVARKKFSNTVLVIWNLACLALLINIVTIAILSMPVSFRVFTNEPSNTIVTAPGISWLPGFLVPLAYGLHFLSLRKLATKS